MTSEQLLRFAETWLYRLCHVRIEGRENIPAHGPAIIASNHLGLLDPPLGFVAVHNPDLTGWVADKHKKNPLYTFFVNVAGAIWIDRERVDFEAIRKALRALKNGKIFGLAPEGTRSPTGALIQPKDGASFLALASGAPVYPAGLTGTETVPRYWWRLRKPTISIKFGKPFRLPPSGKRPTEEEIKQGTEEIMCRIAALLPPAYRGVYADHPRLKELLAASA